MKTKRIVLITLLFALLLCALSGCALKYDYEAASLRYFTEKEYREYSLRPEIEAHMIDKKVQRDLTFYLDSSLSNAKINRAIERVEKIHAIFPIDTPVYLSKTALSHKNEEEFWVNIKDEEDLLLALLLAEKGEEKLPFGCYAGASAVLLSEEYHGNAEKYPYAKELQTPLFLKAHKPAGERKAAWALAEKIAKDYLSDHSLEELLSASEEDFSEIFSKHGANIPKDYRFLVGDTAYPLQIQTKHFLYRFTHDFKDRNYDKEFDLSYKSLKETVEQNERFVEETFSALGGGEFEKPCDVFFGNDLISSIYGGLCDPGKNYIAVNGVAALSHETAHMVLHYKGRLGGQELEESLCHYFSYRSEYASWFKKSAFDVYAGKSVKDNLRGGKIALTPQQKLIYKTLRKIYNANFGKANEETFDAMKYVLSVAGNVEDRRKTLFEGNVYSEVRISLIYYVHETYGREGLLELIGRWEYAKIGEKSFEEILEEWETFLKGYEQREIFEDYMAEYQKKFG